MPKYAMLDSLLLNRVEKLVIVYELGTDNEYYFTNASRKTALLSAYAMQKGYMNNLIKNRYESIDNTVIFEGITTYSIDNFTVLK